MKEISDFSTSVMWWNVKLIHMWRSFKFLHICHVQKFGISPHDGFFLHGHRPCVRDKYQVSMCRQTWNYSSSKKMQKQKWILCQLLKYDYQQIAYHLSSRVWPSQSRDVKCKANLCQKNLKKQNLKQTKISNKKI